MANTCNDQYDISREELMELLNEAYQEGTSGFAEAQDEIIKEIINRYREKHGLPLLP